MSDETGPDLQFEELKILRDRLDGVDAELVRCVAERQHLVAQIGELKSARGHQTRDFKREKIVLEKARESALRNDVDPDLAAEILMTMIRFSLQKQEQARVRSDAKGSGKSALIIGGAGRMGGWFVEFFHSQGYSVAIADPAADQALETSFMDLDEAGTDFDVIVVATTLALSAGVLEDLARRKPRGLVFDVGSLKSPLKGPLRALVEAGVEVTSVHPMFGPSTRLLAGRHVIFVDVGHAEAQAHARSLFGGTMASCIDMDIDQHDRMIAFVLGLSHALNIAFIDTLASSGIPAKDLITLSSSTFDAQLRIATDVVHENPHLYYEIQRLNAYGMAPLDGLQASIDALRNAVERGDADRFVSAMQKGRAYLETTAPRGGRSGQE